MKIILLVGTLCLVFANIAAEQKTITCRKGALNGLPACYFYDVTIGPNETISIKTDPEDFDAGTVAYVEFRTSSIHSLPREIFTKFRNLKWFDAQGQKIQEIKAETFRNANKLQWIAIFNNHITFLHRDTFKGKSFFFQFFATKFLFSKSTS
jgi:hypothetical protein